MTKTYFTKLFSKILAILILAFQVCAQHSQNDTRKQTIDKFLSSLLVQKNTKLAIKFFHPEALSSQDVLQGYGVTEYISKSKDAASNEQGVIQFLNDVSRRVKGNSLKSILFLKSSDCTECSAKAKSLLQNYAFNNIQRDKYYLVEFKNLPKELQSDYKDLFSKKFELDNSFLSYVQYRLLNENGKGGDDIFLVILWAKDKDLWKIIQIGVPDIDST